MIEFKPNSDDPWNIAKLETKRDIAKEKVSSMAKATDLRVAHKFASDALNDLIDGVDLGESLAHTQIRKDKLLSAVVNLSRLKNKLEKAIEKEEAHD